MTDLSSSEINLSVALVTRNRPESLLRTLKSMSNERHLIFEIVISDDSDQSDLIKQNKEIASRFDCKYFSGPQNGLYANRNFVAKMCQGTHIRTMDDDHEFPENHFKICLETLLTDIGAIWTIGEYFPWDKNRTLPSPIPGQLHPRGYSYVPDDMDDYFGISCGASIYPRLVFERNILNSELYKFGILYLEYGARLSNMGFTIKNISQTYIVHHFEETKRSLSSSEIINGARIFSMLMTSFHHKRTLKNMLLTILQITKEVISVKYPFSIVLKAYKSYRVQSNLSFNR